MSHAFLMCKPMKCKWSKLCDVDWTLTELLGSGILWLVVQNPVANQFLVVYPDIDIDPVTA